MMPEQQKTENLSGAFQLEAEGVVALIRFDQPGEPVNTLSPEVGAEFDAVLRRLERDETVRAVVFLSGKPDSFVAGAKIDMVQQARSAVEGEALSRSASWTRWCRPRSCASMRSSGLTSSPPARSSASTRRA